MSAKTDVPGIYKEREGILINKDNEALQAYKTRKLQLQKLNSFEDEISSLKNDMAEIKELLRGLVK